MKSDLKIVEFSEESFTDLYDGGCLKLILDHPDVQVLVDPKPGGGKYVTVHLPGSGAVQVARIKDCEPKSGL